MLNVEINDRQELKILIPKEDSVVSKALKLYIEPFAKEQDALILQGLKLRKEKTDRLLPYIEKFLTDCQYFIIRSLNSGFSQARIELPRDPEINKFIQKFIFNDKIILPDGRIITNSFLQIAEDFERNSCYIFSEFVSDKDTKNFYFDINWHFEPTLTANIFERELRNVK